MRHSLIYVTAPSRVAALALAHALVQERLIACANVLDGATSVYRWEGEIQEEREAVLIAKTLSANVSAVTAKILELHDYSCPCVVALPIEGGNPAFLDWITAEVVEAG
jgi:periplasmic divalent cation tolerance protein